VSILFLNVNFGSTGWWLVYNSAYKPACSTKINIQKQDTHHIQATIPLKSGIAMISRNLKHALSKKGFSGMISLTIWANDEEMLLMPRSATTIKYSARKHLPLVRQKNLGF
jgi:hypothetical protein